MIEFYSIFFFTLYFYALFFGWYRYLDQFKKNWLLWVLYSTVGIYAFLIHIVFEKDVITALILAIIHYVLFFLSAKYSK